MEEKKRPSGLLVGGFLLVFALIIAGLFLPPISLGQRLGLTTAATAVNPTPTTTDPAQTETEATQAIPGEISLALTSGSATVHARDEAGPAPDNLSFKSPIYAIAYEGEAPTGQIALTIPADAAGSPNLDMYGWNGTSWQFIPSQIDANGQQVVSLGGALPQSVALVETAAPASPAIVAVGVGQDLAADVTPLLTAVSGEQLVLGDNGTLDGTATAVATGSYSQLLHATNVGAIINQAVLTTLLNDPALQTSHISDLVARATDGGFSGVNLDYQGVADSQKEAFSSFVNNLALALKTQNLGLTLTLGTPTLAGSAWNSGGQDWVALGQMADTVQVQLPLSPVAYGDGGNAEQLLTWATGQIERDKLVALVSGKAIDRIGESFVEQSNKEALANFGSLTIVKGTAEVEPNNGVEVAFSGSATPLEWDGSSLTYKYDYDNNGQLHNVWLANEAALAYRTRLASRHSLHGIAISGLDGVSNSAGYAAALNSYQGQGDVPQPAGAAIVWTVRDEAGSVLASASGSELTYTWAGETNPGAYTINADFALGNDVTSLAVLDVAVIDTTAVAAAEPTPKPPAEAIQAADATNTSATAATPATGKAVANVGANVRTGPGLGYGVLAGGAQTGTQLDLLGRNADASWLNIRLPDEQEGWIFASLVTVDPGLNVQTLAVIEVAPPPPAANAGAAAGGGSAATPAAPPPVAPITNSGFELGGQTHTLSNPTLMTYAGMRWVKFQHKWGSGDTPESVRGRIDQAHGNGFKVLLSIPGADHSSIDYNAYVSFVGGVAALGPDAIEIWNEQNIDREWPSGQIEPAAYVNNMLAPAYNAIKAANPNVMVISGAPAPTGFFGGCGGGGCDDGPYMAGMAAAGAARYMDCIGIHYNEGIIPPSQTSGDPRTDHYTRYFWGMVNTYSSAFGGARPLCFTELGYLSGQDYGGLPGGFAWAGNTTIAQHAQWLAEAASLAAGSGKVRLFIVFNVDFTTFNSDPQAGFAMIRKDGSCPSCETLRAVTGGR